MGHERATATSQKRQPRQHDRPICRGKALAGATGLEPATSGVTGHFEGGGIGDDRRAIALFMRLGMFLRRGFAWLSEADLGGLLPVCCLARRVWEAGWRSSRALLNSLSVATSTPQSQRQEG